MDNIQRNEQVQMDTENQIASYQKLSHMKSQVMKDITVKDVTTDEQAVIPISVDSYLNQVRQELEGTFENDYVFLSTKQGFKIVKKSEKNKSLSSILDLSGGDMIYIQTQKAQKQKVDEKAVINQKLEEGKKTKAEVEALIKELDTFAQERKDKGAANLVKAEQRLNKIHQGLKRAGLTINRENSDAFISQAKTFLNNNLKDADQLCAYLSSKPDISERELLSKFKGVCQTYYYGEPALERIIDIEKSSYNIDDTAVGGDSTFFNFFKKQSSQSFSTALQNSFTAGEINVGAICPIALLKAGFDVNVANSMKQEKDQVQESQFISTVYFSVNIGRGFSFGIDGVKIKDEVIEKYEKLVKSYFQHKDIDNLNQRCLEFLKYYGYEMDLKTYLFGSTYRLVNQITFNHKQQKKRLETTASTALNASIKGGGICSVGLFAAKGQLSIKKDKGTTQGSESESDTGTCITVVKAFPNVLTEKVWRQLVTVRLDCMKIMGSKKSEKVPLVIVMRNKKNKTPYLQQLDQEGKIGEFQNYFTQLYYRSVIQIPTENKQNDLHVVLVGPTGSGKSYFGNQLVGMELASPFKSSAKAVSETLMVDTFVKDNVTYYDTPGLFDNRSLEPGVLRTKLAGIVNDKRSSRQYKYVNCFLLVIKLADRLQIREALNEFVEMFGEEVLKSLILVVNMTPDAQKINDLETLKKEVPDFEYLKKLYSGFDMDRQVYWNYFFDLEMKTLKDWWTLYAKHRAELFSRIVKLPLYDQEHYNQYRETIKEKERVRLEQLKNQKAKIERQTEERLNQKSEMKLVLDVENLFKTTSYFRLFSKESKCYVSYANINTVGQIVGMAVSPILGPLGALSLLALSKGFNLVSELSNLFLGKTKVEVNQGFIEGELGCEERPEVRMSTKGQELLGYRDPQKDTIQSVRIEFEGGKISMVSTKQDRRYIPSVRVSIGGRYLKDEKGVLIRDAPGKKGSIFEMML